MGILDSRNGGFALCAAMALTAGCGGSAGGGIPAATQQIAAASSYRVLYRFTHCTLAKNHLTEFNGVLYGTSPLCGYENNGVVYSVTTAGVEKILHYFRGGSDGAKPQSGLFALDGTFYGTTYQGGKGACHNGCGTVYTITAAGVEKVLYRFRGGSDGAHPRSGLIYVNGTLYGTTALGGDGECFSYGRDHGCGTVYGISPSGKEKVLYAFVDEAGGEFPAAGLIAMNGTLYGTTSLGGPNSLGIAFSITLAGVEKLLHGFGAHNDGVIPNAPLVAVNGTLYGTTLTGGEHGDGTVFSLRTSGAEQVLYSFNGFDGDSPTGLVDFNGTLYGTVEYGGSSDDGVLYSMSTTGKETPLHSFKGGTDGVNPDARLTNANGTLYGTTLWGGSDGCHRSGCGIVFALTP